MLQKNSIPYPVWIFATTALTLVILLAAIRYADFSRSLSWFGTAALIIALTNRLINFTSFVNFYLETLTPLGRKSPVTILSVNIGPVFLVTTLVLYGKWDNPFTWITCIVFSLFFITPLILLVNMTSDSRRWR